MASVIKVNSIKSTAGDEAITIDETYGMPVLNLPAFRYYANTTQTPISSGVKTKVETGAKSFDTHNWYDATNFRYNPKIAGYYHFNGLVRATGTSQSTQVTYLYKNDAQIITGLVLRMSTSSPTHFGMSDIVYMNGSTDYVELWALVAASSGITFDYSSEDVTSYFQGFLLRGPIT